jgi:hypothetical protein
MSTAKNCGGVHFLKNFRGAGGGLKNFKFFFLRFVIITGVTKINFKI